MSSNLGVVWEKFFAHRTRTLWERFPGLYRAQVVETNDPLNMCRVRFKCPDMHDWSLLPTDCPWAVPAFDLGGRHAARFANPCIGDWIWVAFEKQHPYGPIWTGFANPMREKYYTYPQISQITPVSVNQNGQPDSRPNDYDIRFLPKDGRPMAHGWVDRYGNMDIHSSVGFFPIEHKNPPPPPDNDAIAGSTFQQTQVSPEVNSPDKKYMVRSTKYGCMLILSDQGYHWQKEDESDLGEFKGDAKADEQFEIKRWKNLQLLLNENSPDKDSRRSMLMTRYGSRIELRDTGWAQKGPRPSRSRLDEFGPRRTLSTEETLDQRWIKIRTKGGMLWQAYDKGFDPENDKFIKRLLIDEQGSASEQEDKFWEGKDARWIRTVTRYGFKIVLDDRGSHDRLADEKENPRGNGILLKGRRTPGASNIQSGGNPRGFYWELNENDAANQTMWGSPNGMAVEMNDRYQYMMMAATMGREWASKWRGIEENEFIRKPLMLEDPETNSHHLKLDHFNEYIRLKTRGNQGAIPFHQALPSGVNRDTEINQGFEAHDGREGSGPWVELVDCQHRGLWLSKTQQLTILRGRDTNKLYQWFDDRQNRIVIYNGEENGRIQIYAGGGIDIITDKNMKFHADNIEFLADTAIKMQAGSTKLTIQQAVQTTATINAKSFVPRALGQTVTAPTKPDIPEMVEPDDRGKTYNGPFEECPIEEVEHPDTTHEDTQE